MKSSVSPKRDAQTVMLGAPGGSKLIVRLLLHLHSPDRFRQMWERRFQHSYSTAEMRELYREEFIASHPTTHRYNDIAGFAEVYWDGGTRILVDYYFRGLKRRGFGDVVKAHWGDRIASSGFYRIPYIEIGGVPSRECGETTIREAIVEALEKVRTTGQDWNFFVDLTHELMLLQAIDVGWLFSDEAHDTHDSTC